jgi:hypothetical protein
MDHTEAITYCLAYSLTEVRDHNLPDRYQGNPFGAVDTIVADVMGRIRAAEGTWSEPVTDSARATRCDRATATASSAPFFRAAERHG